MKYLTLVIALLLLSSFGALASVQQALSECRSIVSAEQRLECYDAIQLKKQKVKSEKEPLAQTKSAKASKADTLAANQVLANSEVAEIKAKKKAEFGLSEVQKQQPTTQVDSISLTVEKVKKNARGEITVYLAQGQVWKQNDSKAIRVKAGDLVIVKKAAFNSFLMQKKGASRTMRVKRLK